MPMPLRLYANRAVRVTVPWARPGSGFTLLFECLLLMPCKTTAVEVETTLVGEHDTRLWIIIEHYVGPVRAAQDCSKVTRAGMDETANKRGHNYISLFCDMDEKQLLFATEGKDQSTVDAFSKDLKTHRGKPDAITQACSDMSPAFIAGIEAQLSNDEITFYHFHIVKLLYESVDEVRREEVKENIILKNSRYIWLKNTCNLTPHQKA